MWHVLARFLSLSSISFPFLGVIPVRGPEEETMEVSVGRENIVVTVSLVFTRANDADP